MKLLLQAGTILLLCLSLLAGIGIAETKYTLNELPVMLRTGPGTDRKIVEMVPVGRPLEILASEGDWTQVRLPNGREGWMLSQFISTEMPADLKLERLEKRQAELVAQNKDLQQKLSEFSTQNKGLTQDLAAAQGSLKKVETDYTTLKTESADFVKLKNSYDKVAKELSVAQTKVNKFESDLNKITNSQLYEGMLYGGGLIIFGFIAGFILKRPRRRSPLM